MSDAAGEEDIWEHFGGAKANGHANGDDTAFKANGHDDAEVERQKLRDYLSAHFWCDRDIPEPDRLLGDLISTTIRTFFVGRTGLGKTMFGFALAFAIATGRGFLHWKSIRAGRVLYIDGEMPSELIKQRIIDEMRRTTSMFPPHNFFVFGRDDLDKFAELFPSFSEFAPLNTKAGTKWLLTLIEALGGVDVVVLDNVMSLLQGNQKEPETWDGALPLVLELTVRKIGQVWFDHTGHATDHQYGNSAKAWLFDTVGILTQIEGDTTRGAAFQLSFDDKGKCRRRTPDNWDEFEPINIRLVDGKWESAPADPAMAEQAAERKRGRPLGASTEILHQTIVRLAAGAEASIRVEGGKQVRAVPRTALVNDLISQSWLDPMEGELEIDGGISSAGYKKVRNTLTTLKSKGLCDFSRDYVWPL